MTALDERIGLTTAYGYAKLKGYTGTEEQFAIDLAKAGITLEQIETAIDTFVNTTVPNAVQSVTSEGNKQVSAIQTKGEETLASIPSDYSELSNDVTDLESAYDDVTEPTGVNLFNGREPLSVADNTNYLFENNTLTLTPKTAGSSVTTYAIFDFGLSVDDYTETGIQLTLSGYVVEKMGENVAVQFGVISSTGGFTRLTNWIQSSFTGDFSRTTAASAATLRNHTGKTLGARIYGGYQVTVTLESKMIFRNLQIEIGSHRTAYIPYLTAIDTIARNSIQYSDLYKVFKRVGVCGDSLSVGYMKKPQTEQVLSRSLPYSWVKCVGRDADSDWLNFGTTGQNVLTWCSSETYGKVQMEAANNKCQAYVIGLGENDCTEVTLGSASDIVTNPDTVATSYYGGYARIIQLIKRKNSDAKIFCFTNPREDSTRKPYNDAVRYISETYYSTSDNVYLVDLAADYADFFAEGTPLYIDKQAVSHYSAIGYQMLAKVNEQAISGVMLKHQSDFLTIPFIDYDTGTPSADTMTE